MSTKRPIKIPFAKKKGYYVAVGDMLGYADIPWDGNYEKETDVEWRDPYEFEAMMILDSASRGRSAVEFRLMSAGHSYVMRLQEFVSMVKRASSRNGTFSGKWGFKKQGANFSLVYVGEK